MSDDFTWTTAQFDAEAATPAAAAINELLIEMRLHRAKRDGTPISRSEAELYVLLEHVEARSLRRRADAGDVDALAELIRERAELELRIEEAKERNRITFERICASAAAAQQADHWSRDRHSEPRP